MTANDKWAKVEMQLFWIGNFLRLKEQFVFKFEVRKSFLHEI